MKTIFDILIAAADGIVDNIMFYQSSNNHSPVLAKEVLDRDIDELATHVKRIENNYVRSSSIENVEAIAKMTLKELGIDGLMILKDLTDLFKNHEVYKNMFPNEA